MFRLAWFGLGFTTTHILLDSWTRLVELTQIGEEAQATANDDESTLAYDEFETDSTGEGTTNFDSGSESAEDDAQQSDEESGDEDVANDPAPPWFVSV